MADDYGYGSEEAVTISAVLSYQNPMTVDARGKDNFEIRFETKIHDVDDLVEIAKARGYDALIVKNVDDTTGQYYMRSDVYVVWNPEQIKNSGKAFPQHLIRRFEGSLLICRRYGSHMCRLCACVRPNWVSHQWYDRTKRPLIHHGISP